MSGGRVRVESCVGRGGGEKTNIEQGGAAGKRASFDWPMAICTCP